MNRIKEFEQRAARVPWAALLHAQGAATDTPARLRALWANDEEGVVAGYTHLWSALVGRDRIWPATGPAAQLLTLLIADERFGGDDPSLRAGVLAFFRQIAKLSQRGDEVPPELFDSAMSFLDHPHPPTAQASVAASVALLPVAGKQERRAELKAWLEGAASRGGVADRASAILGLGELGERPEEWLDSPLPGLRLAAALAPAFAHDERATRRLLELSRSPRALDYVLSPMLQPEIMTLAGFDGRRVGMVVAEAVSARGGEPDRPSPPVDMTIDDLVRDLRAAPSYSVEVAGRSIQVAHLGPDTVGVRDGRLSFDGVPKSLREPLDRVAAASLRASLRAWSGGAEYVLEVLDRLPMGAWELVGTARQTGFLAEFQLDLA